MNDNFRHVLNYEAPLTAGNVGTCPRGALEQGHCHQGWSIELQIMEGILSSWQWLVLLDQNDATLIPLRIFSAVEIRPARLFSLCNFANSADCPPKFPILSSPVSSLPEGFSDIDIELLILKWLLVENYTLKLIPNCSADDKNVADLRLCASTNTRVTKDVPRKNFPYLLHTFKSLFFCIRFQKMILVANVVGPS